MKKTLIDVSKKTGYSISTISRVLNGKSEKYRISQSAKEVILQSVKELDYQPDIVAQSLRNNTTYTIGLLVPHIDNPFFANIASVVIREAQRYNYTVMLIDTLEDPIQENKAIDSLLSRKIDGIILVPTQLKSLFLSTLALIKNSIPLFSISPTFFRIDPNPVV